MPKLSKKLRAMWEFFIDPITKRRKYHPRCCRCTHDCKQSFRVTGLWCPRYESKNGTGRNAGNNTSERRNKSG